MKVPVVATEDLSALDQLASDLDFSDLERQAVLLENSSRDINAAPGSGKTTILATKLLLLARKWSLNGQGICVLSHTNVAREEIERRLGDTAEGVRLLAHPHFIGTIHSFVDRFLALPFLRSMGIAVDVIDDDAFARRATGLALRNNTLRMWAQKNEGVLPMIGGLVLRGAELALSSEGGSLPDPSAKSYSVLEKIKSDLTVKGVFRYADMFAFAECLLEKTPEIKGLLSRRFPLVFIDEMQDTSWAQEELLEKLFGGTVVLQRFGDINQRILGAGPGIEKLTFPKVGALSISTSKRFGPSIATAVSGVRVGGQAVVGEAADVHPPMLLTYTSARVGDVLSAFGQFVLDRFTDEALRLGGVKALCTRKQGNAKQEPGRMLLDYWPTYVDQPKGGGARSDQFWSLLTRKADVGPNGISLSDRAADMKRAVLLVLRAAASPHVSSVRDGSQLLRSLREAGLDVAGVRRICRDFALSVGLGATEESRIQVPGRLYPALLPFLPEGMTLEKFQALEVFAVSAMQPVEGTRQSVCEVTSGERRVEVQIGTVASMKGETHLATLVLESLGHPSRRFDLAEALPIVAGLKMRDPKWSEHILSQLRNLYVGMSRPTSFLCVAANANRVPAECIAALEEKGWVIQKLA